MQPRETFNTVYFPTLEQRKNCYKQKNKCPHSFSNAVRTLAMVPVVGLSAQIVLCLHSVLRARTAFPPRPGKTLHRTVLFPRLRVPFDLTKHRGTQRVPLCLVRVVIQHFSKNTVISMVLGHPNSEITCIPPS